VAQQVEEHHKEPWPHYLRVALVSGALACSENNVPAAEPPSAGRQGQRSDTPDENMAFEGLVIPARESKQDNPILFAASQEGATREVRQQKANEFDPKSLVSPVLAIVGYGMYCWQAAKGKTPANLSTTIMYAVNEFSLILAACFTPNQGLSATLVYTVYAGYGLVLASHLLKQTNFSECNGLSKRIAKVWGDFQTYEKWCSVCAGLGITLMLLSKIPTVADTMQPSSVAMLGAIIGVSVNAIASVPLLKDIWNEKDKDQQGQQPHASLTQRQLEAWLPVVPYALFLASLIGSAVTVEEFSYATLISPLGMGITNIVFTTVVAAKSWRKCMTIRASLRDEPLGSD
jgi:hypothetical protein